MAFWHRWFPRSEVKYNTLDLFRDIYGGRTSSTGVEVSWRRAIEVATVLSCCKVIAEGIAQVPFKLFVDDGQGIRKTASDNPLHWVVYRKPNRWQTSFEFRETIAFHLVLTGNAYVFVGRVGSARTVREMIPLEPHLVRAEKKPDGKVIYTYSPSTGQSVVFAEDAIWHIRGPSWNGWLGMEPVKLAREAIGLSIAAESAHSELHKGGVRTSGAYSFDTPLSPEQYELLSKWLDKYAMGGDRAGKAMILDRGAKWLSQQMTGVDAQHIETRAHQIEEVCRAFRVMPIMVGHSDKAATYASAEQMFIAHVVHTLSPWYERIEQSADANLLTQAETEAGYYFKFLPNGLMRGAAKDRAEFYTRAIGSVNASPGWMTTNEVRALEELPPIDGGDELFKPSPAPQPEPASNGEETMKHMATEFAKALSGIAEGTKALATRETPPPVVRVDVASPSVTVEGAKLDIHNHIPKPSLVKRDGVMDAEGRLIGMIESEIEDSTA